MSDDHKPLDGPFPIEREPWVASVRWHAFKPGPKFKASASVTYTHWQCMECGEVFTDSFEMRVHRAEHDGVEPPARPVEQVVDELTLWGAA